MNFKTVLLAAAALGVAGTAQAADLAKKAPAAANYVKVCDAYGAGFFYIPGSETCLKIGGFVRAEYRMFDYDRAWGVAKGLGWSTRAQHGIGTRARGELQFDARTATEMGLLRSYIEVDITMDSAAATATELSKAFIQFGGLTAGYATSMFDFYTGATFESVFGTAPSDSTVNLLAYTFAFGNGISATLSLEDPSTGGRRVGVYGGGVKTTAVVGNVKVEQAWGSAQIMGAIQDNYGAVEGKLGYAIGAGVTVNLPMLAAGDTLSLQAAYAKGLTRYTISDIQDYTAAADFVVVGTSVEQAASWSVGAGLTHNWTKTLSSSIGASYASFDAYLSANDFKQVDVQGNLVWSPVKGLAIGAELEYRRVDVDAASGRPDVDALVGLLRVQRTF